MDILIEVILEIFGEALMELLIHLFDLVVSCVVSHFEANAKSKKIVKYIVFSVSLTGSIVLLVLSYIYAKTAYALLATIYLSISIFTLGLRLINKEYLHKKGIDIFGVVISRLARVAFYVLIFVFLSTLKTNAAKAVLISVSSVVFVMFMLIDFYKIFHLNIGDKPKKIRRNKKEKKELPDEYQIDPKDY